MMTRANGSTSLPARAGIGLRTPHLTTVMRHRPAVPWFEVHAENYMGGGTAVRALERIRRDYPVSIHGVGLSLGSADGLDMAHLQRLHDLVERFGAVPPEVLGEVRFQLEPSLSYVHSSWPIDAIWQANQPDAERATPIHLDAGGVRLEVRRLDDDVTFRPLAAGPFAWRCALHAGHTLEAAIDAAVASDVGFDVTQALQAVLAEGVLVDIIVPCLIEEKP